MKELWFYMIPVFSDNAKYAKKIKKSERLYDYDEAVSSLFRELLYIYICSIFYKKLKKLYGIIKAAVKHWGFTGYVDRINFSSFFQYHSYNIYLRFDSCTKFMKRSFQEFTVMTVNIAVGSL